MSICGRFGAQSDATSGRVSILGTKLGRVSVQKSGSGNAVDIRVIKLFNFR